MAGAVWVWHQLLLGLSRSRSLCWWSVGHCTPLCNLSYTLLVRPFHINSIWMDRLCCLFGSSLCFIIYHICGGCSGWNFKFENGCFFAPMRTALNNWSTVWQECGGESQISTSNNTMISNQNAPGDSRYVRLVKPLRILKLLRIFRMFKFAE